MPKAQELEDALTTYIKACYGDSPLPKAQTAEVRQAFLSGIHWRDTEVFLPGDCEPAIRELLGIQKNRN